VQLAEVGRGVHRVTLPLPWALDHVHCYAVDDAEGWTLIDCGLGSAGTGRRWEQALALLGHPRVRRLVITHYHPDHIGASTRLAEITGAEEIVQGRRDRELTVRTWLDPESAARFQRYLLAHGMPLTDAERSAGEEDELPIAPVEPTRLVGEGDALDLAGEPFDVLVLPGHADGHIALLGSHSGRMFGGDILLDEITPNVGRWDDNEPDPLGSYLDTLGRIEELAPSVVYPGHRGVIDRPAARAQEIAVHHAVRLDEHERALRDGARSAYEVAQLVWGGRLGFHEQRFALAEALAHIERLERLGRAVQIHPNRWRAA
jgi:glyoxylase-like metal-dependent hydrolase (beta-lactamase superfamily II)